MTDHKEDCITNSKVKVDKKTSAPKLALKTRILDHMAEGLARAGLVGEERAAKLIYLVVASRCLERPLCAVVKGQSSAGKSHLVDRVLALFPPAAFHRVTSMSEKALAYGTEPLEHRILVVSEASGLARGDGAYLLRTLISEGFIHHETVLPGDLKALTVHRDGPTGLLATTTAPALEAELETRMFSVPINESREQTTAIMLALAAGSDGSESRAPVDPAPWLELQGWLAEAEHRVVVPFAPSLARSIPPVAVRLRRDFGALLRLIETHALLHQAQRDRDEQGRIVASVEDYAAVYKLVADLVSEGVQASVPPEVRETVEAVAALGSNPVPLTKITQQLKRERSTVLRRVRRAAELGFLTVSETGRGVAMTVSVNSDNPLPEDVAVLPAPEHVQVCAASEDRGTERPDGVGQVTLRNTSSLQNPSACAGLTSQQTHRRTPFDGSKRKRAERRKGKAQLTKQAAQKVAA